MLISSKPISAEVALAARAPSSIRSRSEGATRGTSPAITAAASATSCRTRAASTGSRGTVERSTRRTCRPSPWAARSAVALPTIAVGSHGLSAARDVEEGGSARWLVGRVSALVGKSGADVGVHGRRAGAQGGYPGVAADLRHAARARARRLDEGHLAIGVGFTAAVPLIVGLIEGLVVESREQTLIEAILLTEPHE